MSREAATEAIFRYQIIALAALKLPEGSRVLHVNPTRPELWALVPHGKRDDTVYINVGITGDAPPDGRYVGTFVVRDDLIEGGRFVGHVFADNEGPAA